MAVKFALEVVRVGAAGVALLGGIVVLLSLYLNARMRVGEKVAAGWRTHRPRGVPQLRHIDAHFAQRERKRAGNETFVRVGRRLMPVVPVAVLVFLASGAVLALTA